MTGIIKGSSIASIHQLIFRIHALKRMSQTCGEEYVDEDIATHLLQIAEEASQAGVQINVRRYVAAINRTCILFYNPVMNYCVNGDIA